MVLLAASTLTGSSIRLPAEPPGSESGQIFELQDYRWVPVIVRHIPTAIECTFQVVSGGPTVHAELLSEQDFASFRRHEDYDGLEVTKTGRFGGFRHLVTTPGRYRVLVVNDRGAPQIAVSLMVRSVVNPAPTTLSIGISPTRQFTVVFAALTFFFGTVTWSGSRLLRAWRNR